MLFFSHKNKPDRKAAATRPKTIQDIKKLKKFVAEKKESRTDSLNASIRSMAKRDESFNEFLRVFKAKNEQKWANIIDMTQTSQEDQLLEKSDEYRKNEMIMLEEFRRRKNMKKFMELDELVQEDDANGHRDTGENKMDDNDNKNA